LTSAQFDEFKSLNAAYKEKFHFPFILALRDQQEKGNNTVESILDEFRQRMGNTEEEELDEAIRQIGRIAQHRLKDLIQQEDE
jgi:2-oxo-4-hydroxy-4-carboxy-5-ureidoimidazoline decarboxylase